MKSPRFSLRSAVGFSLVELMIVVTILSGLALLGIPQYRKFVATSRQAEAKKVLSEIHTLQHAYQLDKERYASWAIGSAYGYRAALTAVNGVTECTADTGAHSADALGLNMDGCDNLRYGYHVLRDVSTTTGKETYHAVAFAPSGDQKRIYPNCSGKITSVNKNRPSGAVTALQIAVETGDVQGIDEQKKWAHHKNILDNCD